MTVVIDETHDNAYGVLRDQLGVRGIDLDGLPDDQRDRALARFVVGGPDEVAQQIQTRILDAGIDGVIVNMVGNGHVPGAVALAGKTLGPLLHG